MPILFELRYRSLARGNILVFLGSAIALPLSDYPNLEPSIWMLLPVLIVFFGTVETLRCIQKRWSLYHAGVLLCVYIDLLAISFVLFLFLYPYFLWISHQ